MALALVCCFCLRADVALEVTQRSGSALREKRRREAWLTSAFKKVKKNTRQLTELVAELEEELRKDSGEGLPSGILSRVEELAGQVQKLNKVVGEIDVSLLSVEVVILARGIEEEGKSLRELFEKLFPRSRRNRLRKLANEIRKKADSVEDRMRMP